MKILLLSSKYPSLKSEKGFTPVVHYFAKEWVKLGHEVIVVHSQSKFPAIWYKMPSFLIKRFESKFGFTFPRDIPADKESYVLDNVRVFRLSLFRLFPFAAYFRRSVRKQIDEIEKIIYKASFKPDIIIGHFTNPQLQIGVVLKKLYGCPFALSLHVIDKDLLKQRHLIGQVDYIGFRSQTLKELYISQGLSLRKPYLCLSGIDEKEVLNQSKLINNKQLKLLFVGILIKRKHPEAILHALQKLGGNHTLSIIGDGPELISLQNIVMKLNITEKVALEGYQDRSTVMRRMEEVDCFIMISNNEVFGLVYIEALAKGCIVIAARNEGMDGIIEHRKNGFLCEAGNSKELLSILNHIIGMDTEELMLISQNAVATAKIYTEQKVASEYLKSITN